MVDQMRRSVPLSHEPKRKNRWIMNFDSVGEGIQSWLCQTGNRPAVTIEETEIPYLNTSNWVAGRSIWEQLEVTFIDPIGTYSSSHHIMDWIKQCIQHESGRMGYAINYMHNIELQMLGPDGLVVESWTLVNCWVQSANFGDLDMTSSELANVSVTLRYDYAILQDNTLA
jgi:hypothetical protein